jgi:hypothetical protein
MPVPKVVIYPAVRRTAQKKLTRRLVKTGWKAGALQRLEKLQRIGQILSRAFSERSRVDDDEVDPTRRQSNTSYYLSST